MSGVGAITSYVLKKLADAAITKIGETVRKTNAKLEVSAQDVEDALDYHLREIKNWSSEISFADLRDARATSDVYVPLSVYIGQRRKRISPEDPVSSTSLEEFLTAHLTEPVPVLPSTTPVRPTHVIILGQPGAGKTTSMKHLCYRILHEEDFLDGKINLPVLVRLRDLNPRTGTADGQEKDPDDDFLLSFLQHLVGLRLTYPAALSGEENRAGRRTVRHRILIDFLDSLKALIVFDGFDEIVAGTRKEAVVSQLRTLALQLEKSRIILTSRTGEFNFHIENMAQFELTPLSDQQIANFTHRWLKPEASARLLDQIQRSPYKDTAIRPLTIAHLCAIYERAGRIPDKPKTVYRKIVSLLLEEWDQQRSVKRESAYANFEVDRKSEFLANLAFVLRVKVKRSAYSKQDFVKAYEQIHENFGLPRGEAGKVANELESHTGLFIQAGSDHFEFSHKSLQEYLAAEFIVRLPSIPSEEIDLNYLPNELAIATAISSRPSDYFTYLVLERFPTLQPQFPFIRAFVTRLLLEAPDFEHNPVVGIALVALYSRYMDLVLKESTQLPLFIHDKLADEFSTLGGMIRERLPIADLLGIYDITSTSAGFDGEPILTLRQKMARVGPLTRPGRAGKIASRLPKKLVVRNSLLQAAAS